MNLLRVGAGAGTALLCALAVTLYSSHGVRASDHQDSPTVVARPAADITDVYVYPAPDDPTNNSVVLAMDVYPLIPSGMSNASMYAFDPSVLYQFKIASSFGSGDATEKRVIQFSVNGTGQSQTLTVYGPANVNEAGTTNTLVAQTGTVPFGQATTLPGGIKVFAGPRRDPFFFDLAQFFKIVPDRNYQYHQSGQTVPAPSASSFNGFAAGNANGCSTAAPSNILQNFNVLQIAVEVPKSALVPSGASLGKVGIWATTATQSGS